MTTKKSFKDPTMTFISQDSIDKVDKPEEATATPKGITKPPEGFKLNRAFIETKSKRIHISMQPSLHKKAQETANDLGISVNDFIHRAIQEAVHNDYVLDRIRNDLEQEEQLRKELQEER